MSLSLLATMLVAGTALAGGFEYGPQGLHAVGRGGAFTAKADDPTAMYWNPSRLALLRGTHLLISLNTSKLGMDFDRFDAQKRRVSRDTDGNIVYGDPIGDPVPFDTLSQNAGWFPQGISLAVTSDFGLKDWGIGLSVNGPAAYGKVGYPDGIDSAGRYGLVELDTLLAYVTAAAAYKYKEWFGVGLGLQYVVVPKLKYSLAMMAPAAYTSQNDPVNNGNDLRADLDMSDWTGFSAMLGAWARPVEWLELGFNARIVPIKIRATGKVRMGGTENSVYNSIKPIKVAGRLEFTMPATVQFGARYRHVRQDREVFDIEADFVWEQWSAMDAFRMTTTESNSELGVAIDPMKVTLARRWKDTYSVRLGGQYNAIPQWLTARLGGWWESATQPNAYTSLDLPAFQRFGIGAGLSTNIYGVEIGFSYAHVFQMDRTVAEGTGRIRQQLMGTLKNEAGEFVPVINQGYAVNEGHYRSSYDILTVGVSIDWDTLLKKRK
jgi:long-chain fatty acid transport protein